MSDPNHACSSIDIGYRGNIIIIALKADSGATTQIQLEIEDAKALGRELIKNAETLEKKLAEGKDTAYDGPAKGK